MPPFQCYRGPATRKRSGAGVAKILGYATLTPAMIVWNFILPVFGIASLWNWFT
jgi:hypothetical protein